MGRGAWWCLQPFLGDEDANPKSPAQQAKGEVVASGTVTAYELAIKHGAKVAFGTDTLFNPAGLLLVDGDPLSDIDLIADPEANFKVIVKNGVVHKNAL